MATSAPTSRMKRKRDERKVVLLHSSYHTNLTYSTMKHIHKDRDILLSSLLHCCGFIRDTPSFFTVLAPKVATRRHLETFHAADFLDFLEYPKGPHTQQSVELGTHHGKDRSSDAAYINLLDAYGLTDDCAIPVDSSKRGQLWNYCKAVAGASLHAAHLIIEEKADIAINWSGGRHHAHAAEAGGFCYVNDAVLAIQKLIAAKKRVLYLDIDIHHADGVQGAFYDTDEVMTISIHRHAPGFFPSKAGSIMEKGKHKTKGVGYNLNLPMPRGCKDADFLEIVSLILAQVVPGFNPDVIVLCVGADGLKGDDLVKETNECWSLSPEGIAECVRRVSSFCGGMNYQTGKRCLNNVQTRKLIVLGGGGYNPPNTAKTLLLCTAASCEGSRPGMLWNLLPKDVPRHDHFEKYGPSFELTTITMKGPYYNPIPSQPNSDVKYLSTLQGARQAVNLSALFLSSQGNRAKKTCNSNDAMFGHEEEGILWNSSKSLGNQRKSKNTNAEKILRAHRK
eukprot:scaffold10190_cov294-Chaetoceros_neogracile.AAC.9